MEWDYRYWKVTVVVAIPSDHDVTGLDAVLQFGHFDTDAIVLDSKEVEMEMKEIDND